VHRLKNVRGLQRCFYKVNWTKGEMIGNMNGQMNEKFKE